MGNAVAILAGAALGAAMPLLRPATNPAFRAVNMAMAWLALAAGTGAHYGFDIVGAWRFGATAFLIIAAVNLWCARSSATEQGLRMRVALCAIVACIALWAQGWIWP